MVYERLTFPFCRFHVQLPLSFWTMSSVSGPSYEKIERHSERVIEESPNLRGLSSVKSNCCFE
jgi:hypothetical protein